MKKTLDKKRGIVIIEDGDMHKCFKAWDKKKIVYRGIHGKLLKLKEGDKTGDLLSNCTVCPIGNATCHDYLSVKVYGYHPEIGGEETRIMVCTLGIEGDGDKCPLNK